MPTLKKANFKTQVVNKNSSFVFEGVLDTKVSDSCCIYNSSESVEQRSDFFLLQYLTFSFCSPFLVAFEVNHQSAK